MFVAHGTDGRGDCMSADPRPKCRVPPDQQDAFDPTGNYISELIGMVAAVDDDRFVRTDPSMTAAELFGFSPQWPHSDEPPRFASSAIFAGDTLDSS